MIDHDREYCTDLGHHYLQVGQKRSLKQDGMDYTTTPSTKEMSVRFTPVFNSLILKDFHTHVHKHEATIDIQHTSSYKSVCQI